MTGSKNQKKLSFGFSMSYVVQGMYGLLLGTYIPVYISDILHINPAQIIILTLIAYLPVILKPVLGIISDKITSKPHEIKILMVISCIIFIGSVIGSYFIDAGANINLFAICIFFSFLGLAMIDVNFDTIMVDISSDSDKRIKNITLIMISNQIGAFLGVFIFNLTSGANAYTFLFLISGILAVGLILIILLIPFKIDTYLKKQESEPDGSKFTQKSNLSKIYLYAILFIIFLNGDKMSEWLLEPYINSLGVGYFDIYSNWLQLFIVFSILGYITALLFRQKGDAFSLKSQKTLIVLLTIFAVYWIILPLVEFQILLVLQGIIFFLGGIAYIQFLDIFMMISQFSKQFKGGMYQFLLALFQIGMWISIPLGIALASVLSVKTVLMICAIPSVISAFFVYKMHRIFKNK